MPTATLTYQLPDEEHEFRIAAHARQLLIAIEHADQACRSLLKYREDPSQDAVDLAEEVRRILAEEAGDLLC